MSQEIEDCHQCYNLVTHGMLRPAITAAELARTSLRDRTFDASEPEARREQTAGADLEEERREREEEEEGAKAAAWPITRAMGRRRRSIIAAERRGGAAVERLPENQSWTHIYSIIN